MDLRYSDAERAFRDELRDWLRATLPTLPPEPDRDDWEGRRIYDTHWQRLLFDAGYAGIDWPVEAGGRGASPTEHLIFLEETERAGAPYVGVNFVGLLHAGPTINACGTPEQKRRAPAPDPAGRGGLVPGVLRARRRVRPRLAADPRPCATATTTS
jgi:alkylation response protein AidB-like acyl-CoA dehydrogenase